MVKVTILRDIQLDPDGHTFTKRCSTIEYDVKRPIAKKLHHIYHQQGDQYGTVGDCADYLSHDRLLMLERTGHIRIERENKARARKPTLAQILYEAYREAHPQLVRLWGEIGPLEQERWQHVADAAEQWAYKHVQWEE